ncbi:MAG: DUF1501 domain-containing protein [Planctomycetota bacterium]
MDLNRRDFLAGSVGLGIGSYLASLTLPTWLQAAAAGANDRFLVVLQLTGGNDALNTIIPFGDDLYHRLRPTLRIAKPLPLDDHFGLHPRLGKLRARFDAGQVAVQHGVGYPNPNRSHFRSLDIWHSASVAEDTPLTGWLGRAADRAANQDLVWRVGSRDVPLAMRGRGSAGAAIEGPEDLRWRNPAGIDTDALVATGLTERRAGSPAVEAVRAATVDAMQRCQRAAQFESGSSAVPYPGTGLGERLQLAAQLFASRVGPRVAYVSQDGYDTHSRQADPHGDLLGELDGALDAFCAHMEQLGLADRVLVFVFSEFGRRAAENASRGTDHGAAAPVMLVSPAVQAGLHGGRPRLDQLQDGDVALDVDFRRVYATLLEKWLAIDPIPVVGGEYKSLPLV